MRSVTATNPLWSAVLGLGKKLVIASSSAAHPGVHHDVDAGALDADVLELQRLGELAGAPAGHRAPPRIAADDPRRDEGNHLVDQPRVHEAAQDARASFDEEADDVE